MTEWPSFEVCPSCDHETNAEGYCHACEAHVSEHPIPVSLEDWQARNPELVASIRASLTDPTIDTAPDTGWDRIGFAA